MTLTVTTITAIKFKGLSPKTTDILRRETTLQVREGKAKIGRTVAEFYMTEVQLAVLLDHLVQREITGSGASSKEVKRLRSLRVLFSMALEGEDTHGACTILTTVPNDNTLRGKVIDLLAKAWWNVDMEGESSWTEMSELTELAFGTPSHYASREDLRVWLDRNL